MQPAPLQRALEKTLLRFPHFLCVLRSGLFWYYLEPTDTAPECHIENTRVCSQLFYRNKRSLLFDVSYYHNRINLETYHVLADGTGAMLFLQYLICCYLSEIHPDNICCELADELFPGPVSSRAEDSFKKYFNKEKNKKAKKANHVYHLSGRHSEGLIITEGIMSCNKVITLAKSYGTTVTVFLSALLIMSIHRETALYNEKKPIVLTVPVNLRNYFESSTGRNFFGNIRVAYRFGSGKDELADIISSLKASFKRELTKDNLKGIINGFMAVERNPFVKIVPLYLKNICLRIARRCSDKGETMVISNVGKMKLPPEILQYINNMSVFSSTAKLQVCICTCGDALSVGFSSGLENTDIQRNFFRLLTDMGTEVCIKSNISD